MCWAYWADVACARAWSKHKHKFTGEINQSGNMNKIVERRRGFFMFNQDPFLKLTHHLSNSPTNQDPICKCMQPTTSIVGSVHFPETRDALSLSFTLCVTLRFAQCDGNRWKLRRQYCESSTIFRWKFKYIILLLVDSVICVSQKQIFTYTYVCHMMYTECVAFWRMRSQSVFRSCPRHEQSHFTIKLTLNRVIYFKKLFGASN